MQRELQRRSASRRPSGRSSHWSGRNRNDVRNARNPASLSRNWILHRLRREFHGRFTAGAWRTARGTRQSLAGRFPRPNGPDPGRPRAPPGKGACQALEACPLERGTPFPGPPTRRNGSRFKPRPAPEAVPGLLPRGSAAFLTSSSRLRLRVRNSPGPQTKWVSPDNARAAWSGACSFPVSRGQGFEGLTRPLPGGTRGRGRARSVKTAFS